MADSGPSADRPAPPGTEPPRRFRPRLRYELLDCALHGHALLGTDAAGLRPKDAVFARDAGGLRWYRCLRCDSWVALPPPEHASRRYPPEPGEVILPLRGRPLRDRWVLRLIAVDRLIHFLLLSALAATIFIFATNKAALNAEFTRLLTQLQGAFGGPVNSSSHGIVHDLRRLFAISVRNLYLVGAGVAVYACIEAADAVGLWLGKRWAEYLTFLATVVFVPYEVYELTKSVSALKVLALVINLLIVGYLLVAKRLFGVRGGGQAERAEREADAGWAAIERATPAASASPDQPATASPPPASASRPRHLS